MPRFLTLWFFLPFIFVAADFLSAEIIVRGMPDSLLYRPYAWVGRELPVWGMVSGGAAPYTFTCTFGDGTPAATGEVTSTRQILVPHTYSASGTYVARLTVVGGGEQDSATVRIHVVGSKEELNAEANAAVQDGLRYLYLNQYASGTWFAGPYGGDSYAAGAAMGALAFQEQAYHATDGSVYAATIQKALDAVFLYARPVAFGSPADAHNGNGGGVGFYTTTSGDMRHSYETGIAMMAIVASCTPDAVIATGPLAGQTYRYAVEEAVDWCAWAQVDVTSPNDGRCLNPQGGWRYQANYQTSDNSVTQWPAIGLEAAGNWGIHAPDFVKTRLLGWLARSQNANGGFGYCHSNTPNVARSGGGFCGLAYADVPATDSKVRDVVEYFRRNWNSTGYEGNFANMYAMYGVAKGARICQSRS